GAGAARPEHGGSHRAEPVHRLRGNGRSGEDGGGDRSIAPGSGAGTTVVARGPARCDPIGERHDPAWGHGRGGREKMKTRLASILLVGIASTTMLAAGSGQ